MKTAPEDHRREVDAVFGQDLERLPGERQAFLQDDGGGAGLQG